MKALVIVLSLLLAFFAGQTAIIVNSDSILCVLSVAICLISTFIFLLFTAISVIEEIEDI